MSEKDSSQNINTEVASGAAAEKNKKTAQEKSSDVVEMAQSIIKKDRKITELEQRIVKLEKRFKTNEQFARTLSTCLATQVIGIDAVTSVVRRAITSDAEVNAELGSAIHTYDRHKFRRWMSGFCGVLLWIASVAAAAIVGASIQWLFGK